MGSFARSVPPCLRVECCVGCVGAERIERDMNACHANNIPDICCTEGRRHAHLFQDPSQLRFSVSPHPHPSSLGALDRVDVRAIEHAAQYPGRDEALQQ
jgi:hypothetical protein